MPVYNIPIEGEIGQPEIPEQGKKYFTYADLLMHLNNAKAFDTLNLSINSPGGYCDVADKIIDALHKTGKPITTCNTGDVASAASKIFTIPASKEMRTFYPSRGIFLIHNPWGEAEGDATELAAISESLKQTETDYAKWYAKQTGSDVNVISGFMSENKPLTPEQIDSLGFATIATAAPVKAIAKLKSNTNQMDSKEVVDKMNGLEKMLKSFMAKFKPKAIMLSDVNGVELEFPEITDITELIVGVKVNAAGAPANGDYTMPDGSVISCANGVVTAIAAGQPDQAAQLTAENAKLKEDLAAAQAKLTEMEASQASLVVEAQKVNSEFAKFKAQFSGYNPAPGAPAGGEGNSTARSIYKK